MTLKEIRSYFLSPALPAAALLFGMVFCLAFAQFAGLHWQPSATITLYSGLLVWVALLAWRQRKLWAGIGVIDVLFGAFILWVLASLLIQDALEWRYGRYLPFLAIVPYVCGRLMRVRDVHLLFKIVASAGLVMLMLLAIDYWHNAHNATAYHGYDRWPFFGHGYASLLISSLLAGALIVFYFRSLTGCADSSKPLLWRAADLAAVSLISVVLVWVAARGALLAGLLGIFCLTLILRRCSPLRRLILILYLTGLLALSFQFLPQAQASFYQRLITKPNATFLAESEKISPQQKDAPMLGTASCQPFEKGVDSVAMRWVLYREAVAMFMHRPWRGVGAASFGRHSCTGVMGFPHSTILQAFAELGVMGGLLFVGLMSAAFVGFFRKAVEANATYATQAAQLALAWFTMYLASDQIYGNYFMAAGFYLLAGVAAGMRSNPAWNNGGK